MNLTTRLLLSSTMLLLLPALAGCPAERPTAAVLAMPVASVASTATVAPACDVSVVPGQGVGTTTLLVGASVDVPVEKGKTYCTPWGRLTSTSTLADVVAMVPATCTTTALIGEQRLSCAAEGISFSFGGPPGIFGKMTLLPATGTAVARAPALDADTIGQVSSWNVRLTGFPLVSDDGQRVMYVINESDGMRGYANHKVFIKKVNGDAIERTLPLFDADALDKADRAGTLDHARKKVASNVKAVRDALAATHWTPMTVASGTRGKAFTAGDRTIALQALRLSVTDRSGAKLLDLDARGWKVPAAPAPGPDAPLCVFEPMVESVSIAPDKKLAAVTVVHMETSGGDRCNHSDETHVLAWK